MSEASQPESLTAETCLREVQARIDRFDDTPTWEKPKLATELVGYTVIALQDITRRLQALERQAHATPADG